MFMDHFDNFHVVFCTLIRNWVGGRGILRGEPVAS
jgi:hypothetical protein